MHVQLKKVDLSGNYLTGSLPDSWSGMLSLTHINISSNVFNGSLPSSWSNPAQVFVQPLVVLRICLTLAHRYNASGEGWRTELGALM